MPLPPALLARLKNRGIINKDQGDEEVFAESYDEEGTKKTEEERIDKTGGALGCPNKWNPFHFCEEFCWDKWGDGLPEERLDDEYQRKRTRMKRKYPLPQHWKEVYDAGIGRHYYWNTENDEVCWLSPAHPKAVITEPAPKLAKTTETTMTIVCPPRVSVVSAVFDKVKKRLEDADKKDKEPAADGGGKKRRRKERSPSPPPTETKKESSTKREREGGSGGRYKGRGDKDALDPMDPASYSDIPRGKWSSGMGGSEDTVTGVDTTASGVLFQMRPYPAPGAILRKQKQNTDQK